MSQVFRATYSGIQVYEIMCNEVAVMRRRSDSRLNATQILKVAGLDKSQRTRILEKEIHNGEHQKVQGGYGKYQGTWIPFDRAQELAEQFGVLDMLRPIFEYESAEEEEIPYSKQGSRKRSRRSSYEMHAGAAEIIQRAQTASAQINEQLIELAKRYARRISTLNEELRRQTMKFNALSRDVEIITAKIKTTKQQIIDMPKYQEELENVRKDALDALLHHDLNSGHAGIKNHEGNGISIPVANGVESLELEAREKEKQEFLQTALKNFELNLLASDQGCNYWKYKNLITKCCNVPLDQIDSLVGNLIEAFDAVVADRNILEDMGK